MPVTQEALNKVAEIFERNFSERGELGASVSIWSAGVEVLSLAAGWCEKERRRPWHAATLAPVYSATKGPAAATFLFVLDKCGLTPVSLVRSVWPAFPLENATFAQLLSHQCGLPALDGKASIWQHAEVVTALEAQLPAWPLGSGHGYHPRTFGALLDEPVRRLTGKTLGEVWLEEIAIPTGLDFWLGLPEAEFYRVATLYPGKATTAELAGGFYKEFNTPGTLTRRAFFSPSGLHSIAEMNEARAWAAGFPAMGGTGTASGLAKFYQAAIGEIPSPLTHNVRTALASLQNTGEDKILLRPTAFTGGCQRDPLDASGKKLSHFYGTSPNAFGHPGAGGSHAFACPDTRLSFAYTMNQMELNVMPSVKCTDMVDALYNDKH